MTYIQAEKIEKCDFQFENFILNGQKIRTFFVPSFLCMLACIKAIAERCFSFAMAGTALFSFPACKSQFENIFKHDWKH